MNERIGQSFEIVRSQLENVQQGVFGLANQLYGLTFKEVDNIAKYHEDVKTFEVYDRDGRFLAVLYTDFFPRESKGGGGRTYGRWFLW